MTNCGDHTRDFTLIFLCAYWQFFCSSEEIYQGSCCGGIQIVPQPHAIDGQGPGVGPHVTRIVVGQVRSDSRYVLGGATAEDNS